MMCLLNVYLVYNLANECKKDVCKKRRSVYTLNGIDLIIKMLTAKHDSQIQHVPSGPGSYQCKLVSETSCKNYSFVFIIPFSFYYLSLNLYLFYGYDFLRGRGPNNIETTSNPGPRILW